MRKKREKTQAEKTVEEYFPINEEDLKHTIEKKGKRGNFCRNS